MTNYNDLKASGPELMTLAFFANRFDIKEEALSWGIVEVKPEVTLPFYIPAVLIKNAPFFIDIKKDILCSTKSLFGRVFAFSPAEIKETEMGFYFSSPLGNSMLNKLEIKNLYANKVLSPAALE